jgi:hypothetical protein
MDGLMLYLLSVGRAWVKSKAERLAEVFSCLARSRRPRVDHWSGMAALGDLRSLQARLVEAVAFCCGILHRCFALTAQEQISQQLGKGGEEISGLTQSP